MQGSLKKKMKYPVILLSYYLASFPLRLKDFEYRPGRLEKWFTPITAAAAAKAAAKAAAERGGLWADNPLSNQSG